MSWYGTGRTASNGFADRSSGLAHQPAGKKVISMLRTSSILAEPLPPQASGTWKRICIIFTGGDKIMVLICKIAHPC